MKKNRLILIGVISCYTAFLNISLEEAKQRYEKIWGGKDWEKYNQIKILEFDDMFELYDAWE